MCWVINTSYLPNLFFILFFIGNILKVNINTLLTLKLQNETKRIIVFIYLVLLYYLIMLLTLLCGTQSHLRDETI